MVPRYARPAMTALWEPEAKYRIWFEIEAHATQKLGEMGVVPASAILEHREDLPGGAGASLAAVRTAYREFLDRAAAHDSAGA